MKLSEFDLKLNQVRTRVTPDYNPDVVVVVSDWTQASSSGPEMPIRDMLVRADKGFAFTEEKLLIVI